MSLSTQALIDWLKSLDPTQQQWSATPWSYSFAAGPYINDMPDRLVTVTLIDGAGFVADGALDSPNFQIRVRSPQDDQSTGEAMAYALDTAIYAQHFPQVIDDVKLQLITRFAGAPATLGPPEQPSMRFDYVCTYRTVVGVS